MSAEQGERSESGGPMVEMPLVEASQGQRFAGWLLQIFGVVLLFFAGWIAPFQLGRLIGEISAGEFGGFAIRAAGLSAGGLVGVVIGALMRSTGVIMRGGVKMQPGNFLGYWVVCSVGKVLCVVAGVGMVLGALMAFSAENLVNSTICLILACLLLPAAIRLHAVRKALEER